MRISLLVPVYGVEEYIARCAHSLLSQSYRNIEFVFVNDVTPDRSMEILRDVIAEYPDRDVKIIEHPVNKGVAAARNTALDHATGEYLWYIDSDDLIEPNAVALLADNTGDADIVAFDINRIHSNEVRRQVHNCGRNSQEYVELILARRALLGPTCKLILRNLFLENGVQSTEGISMPKTI